MELQSFNTEKLITVIEPIERLFEGNKIFVKRDDLIPFSFGGNKARKTVYFFRDILEGGYDTVVTYGAGSSNHCRVVANMAAKYGLSCYIISPLEKYCETINSRLVALFDAEIIKTPLECVSDCISSQMQRLSPAISRVFL